MKQVESWYEMQKDMSMEIAILLLGKWILWDSVILRSENDQKKIHISMCSNSYLCAIVLGPACGPNTCIPGKHETESAAATPHTEESSH